MMFSRVGDAITSRSTGRLRRKNIMKKSLIVTLGICAVGLLLANPAYAGKHKSKSDSAAPASNTGPTT